MVAIHHIQYPVGQGGFHLGILGNYAYVYDCGGYGSIKWKPIFLDVANKLSKVDTLDIFISHLHQDHYNNTIGLISAIGNAVQKINIYMPPMGDIEKIMLICEYHIDNNIFSDEKTDDEYIRFVLTGKFANTEKNEKVIYAKIFSDDKIINNDMILRSYTTNVSSTNQKKFINELRKQHINTDKLTDEIYKHKNFWHIAITAFKNTFKAKRITNHIMLNLYCGMSHLICCQDKINWLHTGDAYMMTYSQLDGFNKAFGKLLSNVNFAQIPHHGSKYNHDRKFFRLFNCYCHFYYTTQDKKSKFSGITKSYIDYSCLLLCQQILPVSDNSLTKIEF